MDNTIEGYWKGIKQSDPLDKRCFRWVIGVGVRMGISVFRWGYK